jgi:hypothetical protein
MVKVIVAHHVADYDRWYPAFIEHGSVRREHGATGHSIERAIDDPNNIVIVNEFATLAGARSFMQDPSLPEAMHTAGVDSAPTIWIAEHAESARY